MFGSWYLWRMILPAATMLSLLPHDLNAAQPASVSGSRWGEQEPPSSSFEEIPLDGIQSRGHASLQRKWGFTAVDYAIAS